MSKNNNQRADVKNPNNPAYKAAVENRSNQLNPNHAETKPVTTNVTANNEEKSKE